MKYLTGNDRLINLGIKDETQIEVKFSLKGGTEFY